MAVTAEQRANRVKALRYLARYQGGQGFGWLHNPNTGLYCAVGVLGLGLDIDASDPARADSYGRIDRALGDTTTFVEQLNDGEMMSFGHIAEELMRRWDIETKEIYP